MSKRFLVATLLLWAGSESVSGVDTEPQEPGRSPQGYDAKGKRDPFVPLVREGRFVSAVAGGVGDFSNPALAGILWDPSGHSIALINEMEVKVGDVLGEYEVSEIRQDAVVLMRQGKPLVLQMSFDSAPVKDKKDKGR
ncbi:MAG: hypothetical protein HYY91_05985 [Candidatus Omnitrophica bacterium]|nr:hypothetical protein [Candidatus Omnitrophota bacterium]